MDGTFIEYMNSLGTFSIGTFIAVTVVIGGFIFALVKGIIKLKKVFTDYIANQLHKEEQTQEMIKSIENLSTSVSNIQTELTNLTSKVNTLNTDLSNKINNVDNKIVKLQTESNDGDIELRTQLNSYITSINNLSNQVNTINSKTNLLIESDKESIKSYITDKYYECIEKGFIEVHALQSVESMYDKYLAENGNTFVSNLMGDLRKLPHDKK